MERWERNVRALARKNKKMAEEMERLIQLDAAHHVQVQDSGNDKKILTIEKGGYVWRLNSSLDPEGAAGLYAKRYNVKPFFRYFIFGFSDGLAIRKLLERCDDSNLLIICEPDKEIMAKALQQYDLEDLFSDDRVWPCIFDMWENVSNMILATVDYGHIKLLEFCILPGYDVLYAEACEKFMNEVLSEITHKKVIESTNVLFKRKVPQNILFHMKNMIGQRNLAQVKQTLEQEKTDGMPAIIIGAGPSLDKNIKELKKAEGKAALFVVDAALKSVIAEGIVPDFVCTVDPKAPERFYETVGEREFLWFCCGWSNPEPLKKYRNKVFYHNSVYPWWDEVIQNELDYEYPVIEYEGSVSAAAFQAARYLGFHTIIFVGQDLAFTGGQSYTNGVKGMFGDNEDYINSRVLLQVEDVEGNFLFTDFQMNFYRQWFEKQIRLHGEEIRVIDATEGGAKIEGSTILPLKETIIRECRGETGIHRLLENISPAFSEAQQKRLHQKAAELEVLKEDFQSQVETGILLGQKILKDLESLDTECLSENLKEVVEWNEKIGKHPFAKWAVLYAGEDKMEHWEDILAKEDMAIREMIEGNIRILQSYQAGFPLFEEDFKDVFRK